MAAENFRRPKIRFSGKLAIVVVLLLLQFALRTQNTTIQGAFVDEGLHIQRATTAWSLVANPGQNSHGKFLLYYWLGLFLAGPLTALQASRTAIALVSLVSGATIYHLGRRLHSHGLGVVALLLYVILPLAVFFERMAMADPLASVFSCLIAWRSLIFARHPSRREAVVLGTLLALSTMAKLNMFMLPLLPVILSIYYMPPASGRWLGQVRTWLRIYFGPLVIAAVVVVVLWAPILVPAYLARNSSAPFDIVDNVNLAESGVEAKPVIEYASEFAQITSDFTGPGTLDWIAFCIAFLFLIGLRNEARLGPIIFLCTWLVVLISPMIALASLSAARYAVPIAAPIVLISALTIVSLWESRRFTLYVRFATLAIVSLWVVTFAVPFDFLTASAPDQLPLSASNVAAYLNPSVVSADDSVQHTVVWLNSRQNDPAPVYSDGRLCALIFMYSTYPLHCLDLFTDQSPVSVRLASSVKPGQTAYFLISGYDPNWAAAPGICPVLSQRLLRGNSTLDIWRIQAGSCELIYAEGES